MLLKREHQRVITLVSGVFFLGSLIAGAVPLYLSAIAPPPAQEQAPSETDALKDQAQGYELVLQREPQNQVALEGLAKTRLEMQDAQGAIAPLETLVKLYPEREDYQTLLAETQKQVDTQ